MRTPITYILFFLSGTTALVYELVWVRELIFVFGGTTYAITTVLVAFMAGLGLGSVLAGRMCHRLDRPARVFGYLEIGIGVYAVLVPTLLGLAEPAYRAVYPVVQNQPLLLALIRFCLSAPIMLLPATMMGATLPVMVRYVTLGGGIPGRSVGSLYGINTLGAVMGVILAGFFMLPTLGLKVTTWLAASVDVSVGILAIAILGRERVVAVVKKVQAAASGARSPVAQTTLSSAARWTILVGYAASGFAAMVYQLTWTRALIMALGSSTYSFTCILAAFILGLALGSLAIAWFVDRYRNPIIAFGVLELLIGVVAVLIVPINMQIPYWAEALVENYKANYNLLLAWQFLLIIAITFIPTFLMGAIFPLVIRALAGENDDAGAVTGRAYGVNTIGTILGSFLGGFVLIRSDVLGVQNAIIFASVLNGLVGAALLMAGSRRSVPLVRRLAAPLAALVLIPVIGLGAGRWDPLLLSSGVFLARGKVADFIKNRELLFHADGVDLTVTVDRRPTGMWGETRSMRVNGKPDASTTLMDMTNFMLLGHLPALLGPEGKTACVIGLGSGLTVNSLACDPAYDTIDCIEISEEVIDAAAYFNDYTNDVLVSDPRVQMIRADGRNHLLLTDEVYDLIISQPSNPWLAGVSNLFTDEFFGLCHDRLADDGLLAVWLQGYTMSPRDFDMVVRTLFARFEHVSIWQLWVDDYLLLASRKPLQIDMAEFERRFSVPAVRRDLYRIGLWQPAQLLGRYVASDAPLSEAVRAAPVHTDDNALLEFSAPRHLYESGSGRIAEELEQLQSSVVDDLQIDTSGPHGAALAREIESVVYGRLARSRAERQFTDDQAFEEVSYMLDAYLRDRSHLALFMFLQGAAGTMPEQPPNVGELKHTIRRLRPPVFVAKTGASSLEIAALLRTRSARAAQRGQWVLAAQDLIDSRRFEPDHPDTEASLGRILLRANQIPALLEPLEELLAADPNDAMANYVRAVLAAEAGDLDTALKHLERALATGRVDPDQVRQDDRLGPLKDDPRVREILEKYERTPETQQSP